RCEGPHRLTLNSQATPTTRLRLYESAIASCFVFSRKIRDPATFDFCNTIGTEPTSRKVCNFGRYRMQSGHCADFVEGPVLTHVGLERPTLLRVQYFHDEILAFDISACSSLNSLRSACNV